MSPFLFIFPLSDRSLDNSSDGHLEDYGSNVTESSTLLPVNLSDENDSEVELTIKSTDSPRVVKKQLNHVGDCGDIDSDVITQTKKLPSTYSESHVTINFSNQDQSLERSQETLLIFDATDDQPHPSS